MKHLSFTIISIALILGIFLFISCKKKNKPPEIPSVPSGPSSGKVDTLYYFTSSASDMDEDSIGIRFVWGDEDTSNWSSFVPSGDSVSMIHSWSVAGFYSIKAQAKDLKDAASSWSDAHQIIISNPPNTPTTPNGDSIGLVNISYSFISTATDPDGDSVAIRFDWGDGDTSEWSSWVASSDSVLMSHSWSDSGTYFIKAQAKDMNEAVSSWSGGHQIIIGISILPNNPPNTPTTPNGDSIGSVNVSYSFISTATDPDGDSVAIKFDWGDGDTSEWSAWVPSGYPASSTHYWLRAGTYQVKAQAKDVNEAISSWSSEHQIIITNNPPDTPSIPSGPSTGRKDSTYGFTAITTDPDNDSVSYRFDWGNGDTSEWSAWVPTGYPDSSTHYWLRAGTYQVKAQAKDLNEAVSSWSSGHQIIITNNPPNNPSIPSGPLSGIIGALYNFSSSATDPDGDSIAIRFSWGDGDTSNWSSYVPSGQTITINHSWSSLGTYCVKAQTKDEEGAVSNWSTGNQINISQTFGGWNYDDGRSVQQTSDGGYIIAGATWSYGAGFYDVYLIKTDGSGNQQWYKTFGDSSYDGGSEVQLTSDGGYIIAGSTDSYGVGNEDVYLIKTDGSGNQQWYKTFGGTTWDEGFSVQLTSDGGYIIAGSTNSYGAGNADVYLIKTDGEGNQQWYKTFGGSSWDYGNSIQQTSDGGYIIAGYTNSYGAGFFDDDVYLIKTDANGNQQWYKTFGGTTWDEGFSVQLTSDGGYIIAGATVSYGVGNGDVYLIKTDGNGNQQWYKTFGGTARDIGFSVQLTSDGGYIITGDTESYGAGEADVYLIKTDANGNAK